MKTKGFTLVELIVVIIIVGILSLVSVPIYKGYIERAYLTEGMAIISAIRSAQQAYYIEHQEYAVEGTTNENVVRGELLDIDLSTCKYFANFRTEKMKGGDFYSITLYTKNQLSDVINAMGFHSGAIASSDGKKNTIRVRYNDGTYKFLIK